MSVRLRNSSARARSKRGCTPAQKLSAWLTFSQRGSTATSAMKHTSLISASRCARGSMPSTRSSPSKVVSPRIALSAVVLPAPFGPMRPTMRPGPTLKLTSSSARLAPLLLVSPRASITVVIFFLTGRSGVGGRPWSRRRRGADTLPFVRRQPEALGGGGTLRPLVLEKALALVLQQRLARAGAHEHAAAAAFLHQLLVDQLLVALEHR